LADRPAAPFAAIALARRRPPRAGTDPARRRLRYWSLVLHRNYDLAGSMSVFNSVQCQIGVLQAITLSDLHIDGRLTHQLGHCFQSTACAFDDAGTEFVVRIGIGDQDDMLGIIGELD